MRTRPVDHGAAVSWLSRHPLVQLALLALLATVALGCKEDEPAGPAAPARSTGGAATGEPPAPSAQLIDGPTPFGILSEEEFKKLHVLRADRAPRRRGEEIELGARRAYLSVPPKGAPPLPALVVIHEWWGLNEHIMHWTDRLAADGYAALAVDLYGGKVATTTDEAMKLMKAVDERQARKILLDAFAFLAEDRRIKAEKRGAIGWCFGGKWSLELALEAPQLDAAVVYYGHVTNHPERLAKLEASLLAIFGKRDEVVPPATVDRFEFGLEQAGGKDYKVLRYDAEHAFANPSSARYDAKAASAAWSEVRSFLAKHLKGTL